MEATTTASLLSKKDRQLHPRGQIAKLVRIARRAECKGEWMDTMLGTGAGDRTDPSFGFFARMVEEHPEDLEWRRQQASAIKDRDAAYAKATRAAAEIARIAAEHGIRP
jgi:hypothetical protein